MAKINVTRSSMPSYEEYCEEIKALWDSRWLTNCGAKHQQLEQDLREYLGVSSLTLFVNGHLALEYALEAMDFPKGSEVITTPFTFASTTNAIVRMGLTPVFCDIKPDDYTLDPEKIEALITQKTVAILPVHVYGNLCQVERIQEIARKHSLKVIYDAAHAFGVTYRGKSSAEFGDIAMYSFHATKAFHSIEGGMLAYREEALSKQLDARKNFGIDNGVGALYCGGNGKMNEFAAAMGICNLRHLAGEIAKRKAVVERYRSHLEEIPGLKLNPVQPDVVSNYAYFPVVFDGYKYTRDEVFQKLAQEGITARQYFYPLTNEMEYNRGTAMYCPEKTPVAKMVAENVLTLPLYADLALEDVDRICRIVKE